MCHAPDSVSDLLMQHAGRSVALMLSGHTHGGQVRIPLLGAFHLPPGGRKYIEGWFPMGSLQLYVNRGIGSVGVPFRFNSRPEIRAFTLRTASGGPTPAPQFQPPPPTRASSPTPFPESNPLHPPPPP